MAIDAQVETVFVNEDGSGRLALIDRPAGDGGSYPGCRGQASLHFKTAPDEVTALNGLNVWGSDRGLMLGDREIARRTSYAHIEFNAGFTATVGAYHERRREAVQGSK